MSRRPNDEHPNGDTQSLFTTLDGVGGGVVSDDDDDADVDSRMMVMMVGSLRETTLSRASL